MLKSFSKWLLYKKLGWNVNVSEHHPNKYIICLAPHTSNWDFIIGQLYACSIGLRSNFLMKKEWFFWPLGPLFKRMGGIPVWRSKNTSMTDNLAQVATASETFKLCITPEGTRSVNPDWKKGFYYIAHKAEIPILLYGLDYQKKLIECTKTIIPNGNIDNQMREIKLYFKDYKGKNPQNFSIGNV